MVTFAFLSKECSASSYRSKCPRTEVRNYVGGQRSGIMWAGRGPELCVRTEVRNYVGGQRSGIMGAGRGPELCGRTEVWNYVGGQRSGMPPLVVLFPLNMLYSFINTIIQVVSDFVQILQG
jgi:hypothetical protein